MEIEYNLSEIEKVAQLIIEKSQLKTFLFKASMGAGKTTLIKSLCKQLGIKEEITSPTFSLVNEYQSDSVTVFHFDLYRLDDINQLNDIGFEEYISKDAYVFIEWPEFALSYLYDYHIVMIDIVDNQKRKLKWI